MGNIKFKNFHLNVINIAKWKFYYMSVFTFLWCQVRRRVVKEVIVTTKQSLLTWNLEVWGKSPKWLESYFNESAPTVNSPPLNALKEIACKQKHGHGQNPTDQMFV